MTTNILKFKKTFLSLLFLSICLSGVPANAHDHKQSNGYVAGKARAAYNASRHRDRGYNRNHGRSSVYIGFNYGYPARYRGSYIGFGYGYPLSNRYRYDDWRYSGRNNYRGWSDSDQLIATATGAFIGALIGSEIARYLDDVDRLRARDANLMAQSAPIGQQVTWNSPRSNHYGSTTATRDGYSESGKYCREFYQTISIGGRTEEAYGTACQQPDGDWQLVQPLN
jgi:surface antigen